MDSLASTSLSRTVLPATITGCLCSIYVVRVYCEIGETARGGRAVLKASLFAFLFALYVECILRKGISPVKRMVFSLGIAVVFFLIKFFVAL